MAVFNEPNQWVHPLGNNADISTLPDDAAATAGIASLQKLFQIINATPLEAGGIAPDREDVNALFKYLGDQIFYTLNGGVPSYNAAYDYIPGRVVLYNNNNLYKCIHANTSANPKAPTDSAYWTKIATLSDFDEIGFKTGDIKIQTTSTIPSGWLLCNGAAISRTTYAKLFAAIGTMYGAGDGSTTFNLPDLRDRFIEGAGSKALGTYLEAGLPNITGMVDGYLGLTSTKTGAFSVGNISKGNTPYSGEAYHRLFLDASQASSIYKNNVNTVQPSSLVLNHIIKC